MRALNNTKQDVHCLNTRKIPNPDMPGKRRVKAPRAEERRYCTLYAWVLPKEITFHNLPPESSDRGVVG